MLGWGKESGDYLSQIQNNTEERVAAISQLLENGALPKTREGIIKVVELGVGGGNSLRKFKNNPAVNGNVDLIAVDIIPKLVISLKKEMGVNGVAADAGNLPFADSSISAVNASAILHEVSSYGTKNQDGHLVYGREAVVKTLGELNRVLLPEGVVAYRDVLAPSENFKAPKRVEYSRESWRLFADWFLKDFLTSQPYFYEGENAQMEKTSNGFILDCPVGLQKELQRHYLMLRDYLRTVRGREFGVSLLRSGWLRESEGLKSITFSIDERLAPMVDLSSFEVHGSSGGRVYKGDSDMFDKLYDDLMAYYFQRPDEDLGKGNSFKEVIDDWKKREGQEHYFYGNIRDMLKFSVDASAKTKSNFVLFPESAADVTVISRDYYNRYLSQVADQPEKDGKQVIVFKKLPVDQALKSAEALRNLSVGDNIFDENTITELRTNMEHIHGARPAERLTE